MDTVLASSNAWSPSSQVLIPILTVIGTVLVAVVSAYFTYRFTRRLQLEAEWRKDKLRYYSQLIDSITETMSYPEDFRGVHDRYAKAHNIISLIAPQNVANIVFEYFFAEQHSWDQEMTKEEESELVSAQKHRLKLLVLEMRKDLRISPKDDPDTFQYKLRSPVYTPKN